MSDRQQRNADYRAAGVPALQDADPEPPTEGLSWRWWAELVTLVVMASFLGFSIFKVLHMMGL